ncbi:ABC transporter permease [Streptomyces sp. NPDC021098]|uniref:ABC transporter permease n=1 Tax=unclassified Streptomyces TaxID=2593676 RepID=UPI003794AD7F
MVIQERLERPADTPHPSTDARWHGAKIATQLSVLTGRQLRSVYSSRRLVVFSLLQPVIMLLLFSQVFGSMADPADLPHGVRYIDYVVPALLITTGIASAQAAGVGLVGDMNNGMVARFRVLPTRLSLVLVARSLADLFRVATQLCVLLVVAYVVLDFHPAGGLPGTAAALILTLFVIWSLIWGFIALAAWLRGVELIASIAALVMFPLTFVSSAFVPLSALPEWLRWVAHLNPVTYAVEGSRRLALGWDPGWSVPGSLATGVAFMSLAVCVAVRAFRRPPNE